MISGCLTNPRHSWGNKAAITWTGRGIRGAPGPSMGSAKEIRGAVDSLRMTGKGPRAKPVSPLGS